MGKGGRSGEERGKGCRSGERDVGVRRRGRKICSYKKGRRGWEM